MGRSIVSISNSKILILVVLTTLLISSCNSGDVSIIDECVGVTATGIHSQDDRILCIGNYDNSLDEYPVCLKNTDGSRPDDYKRIINQMYANIFITIQHEAASGGTSPMTWSDALDAGAVAAEYLFGDGHIDSSWGPGDGFNGDRNSEDEGGSASYSCAQRRNIPVSYLGGTGDAYSMSSNDAQQFADNGVPTIPGLFVCESNDGAGYTNDEGKKEGHYFDLHGTTENAIGLIVTQKIQNVDGNDYDQYLTFLCTSSGWKDWDYIVNNYDQDGDGAPGLLDEAWDCNEENPNVYTDLSIFVDQDGVSVAQDLDEICGDGVSNICQDSNIYDTFDAIKDGQYEVPSWDLETTDSCDYNYDACQRNCLYSGGVCDYSVDTSDNGNADLGYYGSGICCGDGVRDETDYSYDLTADIGYIIGEDEGSDTEKICLHEDYVAPVPTTCDTGGWCWVDAESDDKFNIFTVKYLGLESFDVMSNYNEWMTCSESNEGAISGVDDDPDRRGNRFYCYEEGDHYSLAECSDPDGDSGTIYNEGSVKHRTTAAGEFALPNVNTDTSLSYYHINFEDIDSYTFDYLDLYQIGDTLKQTVDFTGYEYLDILFKFSGDELTLPANINLTIKGLPEDINAEEDADTIYFSQNVLGYAVNEPLLELEHVIHLRVPVSDWPDIKSVDFASTSDSNKITVLGMYLTKDEDINYDTVPICSGKDSRNFNSWLTDLDDSDDESDIDGNLICDLRYGEYAWLGDYEGREVLEGYDQAPCCGDDLGEFYAGKSANEYGCFNGLPIKDENTVMQVEFEVTSSVQEYNVSYPPQDFTVSISYQTTSPDQTINAGSGIFALEIPDINWVCDDFSEAYQYDEYCSPAKCSCDFSGNGCDTATTYIQQCSLMYTSYCEDELPRIVDDRVDCTENQKYSDIYHGILSDLNEFSSVVPVGEVAYIDSEGAYFMQFELFQLNYSYTISYDKSPIKLAVAKISDLASLSEYSTISLEHSSDLDSDQVYFFTPHNQQQHFDFDISYEEDLPAEFELWIVAETDQIAITSNEEADTQTKELSYTCLTEECVYALPGTQPYYITNTHPELYDMYFIGAEDSTQETLITSTDQEFDELGVIKVVSISQQILYDYDYEEEEGGFYGCEAASYVLDAITDGGATYLDNYDFCAIQGDYYCAHQDSKRLVNSWSLDSITQVAYEPVDEWDEDTELSLESVTYDSSLRNHSTAVVPQRNFIPNADFDEHEEDDGDNIAYWQLLDSSDAIYEDEMSKLDDGEMTISSAYTFISDNIAIEQYQQYSYSDSSDCDVTVTAIDKDGNNQVITVPSSFESQEYSFLKISVQGSCTYKEPMLQRTDDLGAADYEYNDEYPIRQGAACCPENMCWNGYVCANNMAEYTYMTEEPQENQTYRCINGDWTYMEPQYDWNGEETGFCETTSQCFVTSSLSEGAEYGATNEDFYEGIYPYCIETGEYLLDHYCDEGQWSSRTKFLATKLLSFAESDDYVLYCAPFRQALPDYAVDGYNYENYLAGEVSATVSETDSLSAELTGDSATGSTTEVCFDALENSETGRRLVRQEDNTCINAVCVLQYKNSNTFESAFATSMNHNVTSDESFLIPLGVSQGELEDYCTSTTETDNFIECDDAMWYNDEINSVIYAREGISFDPSLIDSIVDWFLGLFSGDTIEQSEDFIDEATNFNTIYLLSKEGFVVRAVQEIELDKETLIAEYTNFDLPICDYINNVNEEYTMVEQWPAEPEVLVNCELTEDGVYKIMTATNTDYWWPQLTSKLRVNAIQ